MTTNNTINANSTSPLAKVNGGTGVNAVTTAPTATSFAGWDANSNLSSSSFIEGFATTVTAAGTTTLTVASKQIQEFTGSTTQTVVMPVVSTLVAGQGFDIINNSSAALTINSSGGNLILTMAANTSATIVCVLITGTTAASWNASYFFDNGAGVLSITGTANQVIASASTGAVTLSLPQSIAAASSPTFAGLTLTNPYIAGSGGLHSFQIFTSGTAATYTKPANVTSILVEVIGGGGGSGGIATTGATSNAASAGGGGGGYSRLFVPSAASTYTYTVGAGGVAGTAGNNAGGAGGTTTFSASSLQATGGAGGGGMAAVLSTVSQSSTPGDGGIGSNGNFSVKGSAGGAGFVALLTGFSGFGGSSIFGGSASSIASSLGNSGGFAGYQFGGGASGSYASNNAAIAGSAGSVGLIIVWEFA
jgi:hypothetical protein